jgi:hypothetical protein
VVEFGSSIVTKGFMPVGQVPGSTWTSSCAEAPGAANTRTATKDSFLTDTVADNLNIILTGPNP